MTITADDFTSADVCDLIGAVNEAFPPGSIGATNEWLHAIALALLVIARRMEAAGTPFDHSTR